MCVRVMGTRMIMIIVMGVGVEWWLVLRGKGLVQVGEKERKKKRVVGGVVQYLQIVSRPLPIREDIRGETSGCSTTALSHSVCELKLFVRWSVLSCPVLSCQCVMPRPRPPHL